MTYERWRTGNRLGIGDPSGDAWRLCLGEEKAEPDEPPGV